MIIFLVEPPWLSGYTIQLSGLTTQKSYVTLCFLHIITGYIPNKQSSFSVYEILILLFQWNDFSEMWICSSYTEGNSKIQILTLDKIYRFQLKVYPLFVWRVCPPYVWRTCPPLFLYAVFVADWRAVLGKSGCCEEKCKQSLSVTPMESHG